MDENELRKKITPLSAIYSVAEHSRSLLVALNDGVLPSNVKGGYNLRVLLRRSLNFIEKYGWKLDLPELCKRHAKELKKMYPELLENLDNVTEILEFEKNKYKETKTRNRQLIGKMLRKGKEIKTQKLLELYDNQGISPEEIKEEGKKQNQKIEVPENFYSLVNELHEKKEQKTQTKKQEDLQLNLPPTKILYYDHYDYVAFEAKILKIIKNKVILDRTAFYPTSGGQLHDEGKIGSAKVLEVYKQGPHIVHVVKGEGLKVGQKVDSKINIERRTQLAQHHTATHILNGVAKSSWKTRFPGRSIQNTGKSKIGYNPLRFTKQ